MEFRRPALQLGCQRTTARLYFVTARKAKTAAMPTDQATAPQTELPAGSPMKRARIALTVTEKGFHSANHWRAPGIVSGGTKAEETKVRGKIRMKPMLWAASGDEEVRPMKAKT